MNTQELEKAFLKLVDEDIELALQIVTGMFVGLTIEYTKLRGHDTSTDLVINGCGERNITIHAAVPNVKLSGRFPACD